MSTLPDSSKSQLNNGKEKIPERYQDIVDEFKTCIDDLENLVKHAASLTGDELAQARVMINQRINRAKKFIASTSETALQQANKAATSTNEYVHEKPWTVIGTSAVVSFVLGVLLAHHDQKSTR